MSAHLQRSHRSPRWHRLRRVGRLARGVLRPVGRRDERGAAAIVIAMSLVFIVPSTALAVDLGLQRVVRSDVQALSDSVALDAARSLNGTSTAPVLLANAAFLSNVSSSLTRNATTTVGTLGAIKVEAGSFTSSATGTSFTSYGAVTFTRSGTTWTATTPTATVAAIPNAVRVTSSGRVGFAFSSTSGAASRSAVASQTNAGLCFALDTSVLELNSDGGALSALLSGLVSANLSVGSSAGLVALKGVSIPLASLLVQLNIVNTSSVATANVTLSQVIAAEAAVLRSQGNAASAAILESIRLKTSDVAFNLGSILNVTAGQGTAGLAGSLNVLDLLSSSLIAADGRNGLTLAMGVGDLANVKVTVLQPPQIACGGPGISAHAAQIQAELNVSVPANKGLGLVDGGLHLAFVVGYGQATLTALSCNSPESATFDVTGAAFALPPPGGSPVVAGVHVTMASFLGILGPLSFALTLPLKLLGLDVVGLDIALGASIGTSQQSVTVNYPPAPTMPGTTIVNGNSNVVPTISALGVTLTTGQQGLVSVLGASLNQVLGFAFTGLAVPIVNQVIAPLLNPIISTILNTLGISVGATNLTMLSRPACTNARLDYLP